MWIRTKAGDATRQPAFLYTTNVRWALRCEIKPALLTFPLNSSDAFIGSAKESMLLVLFVSRITEKTLRPRDTSYNWWHSAILNFKLQPNVSGRKFHVLLWHISTLLKPLREMRRCERLRLLSATLSWSWGQSPVSLVYVYTPRKPDAPGDFSVSVR